MVTCRVCNKKYKQLQPGHLKKHGICNVSEYRKQFPNAKTTCEETKRKISEGTKIGMDNEIVRNKLKYIKTTEHIQKIKKTVKQLHKDGVYDNIYTHERNEKISKFKIKYWQKNDTSIIQKWLGDYIGSEKHIELCKSNQKKATKAALRSKVSNPEKEFAKELKKEGIEFIQQYYVNQFPFDFYIPSKNLLIEIDGEFYHPLKESDCIYDIQKHNFERDIRKTKLAKDLGYKLKRIRV